MKIDTIKKVLIFLIVFPGMGFSNNLLFEKEIIEVDVAEEQCAVIGSYYFKNTGNEPILNRTIYYPFPVTADLPYPDSIIVFDPQQKQVHFAKTPNGIFFKINIIPMNTECYTVKFYQRTTTNRYEYILSTTQNWKRPLSSADFIITFPHNLPMEYISLHYDRIEESGDKRKYYIHKENFYPVENLIIKWRSEQ